MAWNISLKGEDVFLKKSRRYLVMDALYLDKYCREKKSLDFARIEEEAVKLFPFSNFPLASITMDGDELGPKNFLRKKSKSSDLDYFSTDTGLIVLINRSVFKEFVEEYSYDELVKASLNDDVNIAYWERIVAKFDRLDCALILSEGMDSKSEFTGSGTFFISQG